MEYGDFLRAERGEEEEGGFLEVEWLFWEEEEEDFGEFKGFEFTRL